MQELCIDGEVIKPLNKEEMTALLPKAITVAALAHGREFWYIRAIRECMLIVEFCALTHRNTTIAYGYPSEILDSTGLQGVKRQSMEVIDQLMYDYKGGCYYLGDFPSNMRIEFERIRLTKSTLYIEACRVVHLWIALQVLLRAFELRRKVVGCKVLD